MAGIADSAKIVPPADVAPAAAGALGAAFSVALAPGAEIQSLTACGSPAVGSSAKTLGGRVLLTQRQVILARRTDAGPKAGRVQVRYGIEFELNAPLN